MIHEARTGLGRPCVRGLKWGRYGLDHAFDALASLPASCSLSGLCTPLEAGYELEEGYALSAGYEL